MEYIRFDGVRIYYNFKLLFKGFLAITLFGNIYCKLSKNRLYDYLNTYNGSVFLNHEKIHMEQSKQFKLRWFSFYVVYLFYWLINLFRYGFNMHAYYNIPFEREAYSNQENFEYIKNNLVDWKKYR